MKKLLLLLLFATTFASAQTYSVVELSASGSDTFDGRDRVIHVFEGQDDGTRFDYPSWSTADSYVYTVDVPGGVFITPSNTYSSTLEFIVNAQTPLLQTGNGSFYDYVTKQRIIDFDSRYFLEAEMTQIGILEATAGFVPVGNAGHTVNFDSCGFRYSARWQGSSFSVHVHRENSDVSSGYSLVTLWVNIPDAQAVIDRIAEHNCGG